MLALGVFPSQLGAERPARLCTGKEATLQCLNRNFHALFVEDEDRFASLLEAAKTRALQCADTAYTAAFLGLIRQADGWVKEHFDEVLLVDFLRKPKCLLDAALRVDDDWARELITGVLRSGSEEVDAAKVRRTFQRYKDNPKYREFLRSVLEGCIPAPPGPGQPTEWWRERCVR